MISSLVLIFDASFVEVVFNLAMEFRFSLIVRQKSLKHILDSQFSPTQTVKNAASDMFISGIFCIAFDAYLRYTTGNKKVLFVTLSTTDITLLSPHIPYKIYKWDIL